MNPLSFLDDQIKILQDESRRNYILAALFMVIGAGLIVSGHWILSLLPMFKTDPGNSLHSQLMAGGGGLFTLALTVAPLKQITPNRKRIAIFIAAKSMPAESIERIISESLREALKP